MVDVCGVRISTKMEVESYESGDGCGGCLVIVVMTVVVTFQINSTPQASTPTPTTTHLRYHPQGPTEGGGEDTPSIQFPRPAHRGPAFPSPQRYATQHSAAPEVWAPALPVCGG